MRSNLTTSDIFDVNKRTGGLILGKTALMIMRQSI